MVKFIMEMVSNHSFTLHTNYGQHSRLRYQRDGVPQGSVLAPIRLMLSMPKMMSASFHLNNRQAKHQLNVTVDNNRLQFQNVPTYLVVKLDRSLIFKEYLVGMRKKNSSQIASIRRLAGTIWGAAMRIL